MDSATYRIITERKQLTPSIFHSIPEGDQPIGFSKDEIKLDFWNNKLGSVAITFNFDRFMEGKDPEKACLLLMADDGKSNVDGYVALPSLEMQSSGFRYDGNIRLAPSPVLGLSGSSASNRDMMLIHADPSMLREYLAVPLDPLSAFGWREMPPEGFRLLPVSELGGRYLLNLTVSGEFRLTIYYIEWSEKVTVTDLLLAPKPELIFSRNFCCK